MSLLLASSYAQDRTTVNAMSSEISDNLDLRAVASIFGDSNNLEDFENRLNDPINQISNLDLNNDDQVDYLRVIESVEGRTHIIVIQSVLGRDTFQDVATLEIEKDRNNHVQVQVVGDVFMYGNNYIYEPVYVQTPIIYNYFWTPNYIPYCSLWYWNYYPSYYYAWNPCPIFRYRNHIGLYINYNHHYNYVNYRRCQVAYTNYYARRGNGYERQYPNRSFANRNSNYSNRYELDKTRNIKTIGVTRNEIAYNGSRNENSKNIKNGNSRSKTTSRDNLVRDVKYNTSRNNTTSRDVKNSETTSRNNTSRDVKYNQATSKDNSSSRDVKYNPSTSRNNSFSGDVKNNQAISRDNSQRKIKNETSRSNPSSNNSPRSSESRNYSNENSRSSSTKSSQDSSPRVKEQRNNSSKSTSKEGEQSRSSVRR